MTGSIPASQIVSVNPGVIGAGGTALSLNGLVLTSSTRVPIGTVLSFPTAPAVATYFGANSQEATIAAVYFSGPDNSTSKPGALLFSQYPTASVSAYLRGATISGLSLAQLQALTGILIVTIDGVLKTSSAINLSAATSFSNAAQIINAALAATGPTAAVVTGSIAATVLTVTAVTSGALVPGAILTGTGITAGTYITSFGTGTGGPGTYNVSVSQSASAGSITATAPTVSYDSVAGAFVVTSGTAGASSTMSYGTGTISQGLGLAQTVGAITSQGAVAATPAGAMTAVSAQTQNWASFFTAFEPITADKLLFAAWTHSQNGRFAYICWDTDITATQQGATSSAGYQIKQLNYSGTFALYEPQDLNHAAFVAGIIASIDFTAINGRTNPTFRTQSGLTPGVTDATIAANLIANSYNYFGAYATATTVFNFLYPGQISGPFLWADSYVDQIWLNSELQIAMLTLLTQVGSVPYNASGYGLVRAACMDPINAALNFGAIRAGVPLSALQAAEVNAAAGVKIDDVLSSRGWYLQIVDATAQVRAARGSPPMTLWYTDGESIQKLNLASQSIL